MAGFDHGPSHSAEQEDDAIVERNARYGMVLFIVYLLLYAGFVLATAFQSPWLAESATGGVNVAIWYGMILIGGALFLALVYGWLCRGGQQVADNRPQ